MKLNTLMAITSILGFVFGLAFFLVPAQSMALYGVPQEVTGQWNLRYLGSAFLGVAAVNWLAKNASEGGALRAIVLGTFFFAVTGLLVAVFHGLYGPGNALVWLNAVIYLFMTLGYGYFHFKKPAGS